MKKQVNKFGQTIKSFLIKHQKELLSGFLILLVFIFVAFMSIHFGDPKEVYMRQGDASKYIQMSEKTFSNAENPFALRILSPFIVHSLNSFFHTGINKTWLALTFISTYLSILFFYLTLKNCLKLNNYVSLLFTMFLLFTYNFTFFNLGDYWLVDPLSNLFIVLSLYFLFSQKPIWFILTIIIGSFNKETMLFFAPLYPLSTYIKEGLGSKNFKKSILLFLIMIMVYFLYRIIVKNQIVESVGFNMFAGEKGGNIIDNIRFSLSLNKDIIVLYGILSFLWVFGIFALYKIYSVKGIKNLFVLGGIYLFCAHTLGRVFASDVQRVYVAMAPFIIIMIAGVYNFSTDRDKKLWLLLLIAYIAINLNWLSKDYVILVNIIVISLFAFFIEVKSDKGINNNLNAIGQS